MLNIHKLSISFQGDFLFENISFRLQQGDRVGLIGKNGAGKSTYFELFQVKPNMILGSSHKKRNLK